MSEYPEHIDQIDDFYRSQLADHEIAPPEGLWDRISLGAFETQSTESSAAIHSSSSSASLLTTTQKIIGGTSAALLIVAGLFYFYSNKEQVKTLEYNAQPSTEQPTEELNNTHTAPGENNYNERSISPSTNKKTNSATVKEGESTPVPNDQEAPVNENQEEVPVIINTVPQEEKVDSIADIKTTQKAPKEKVKFKDKHKKDYQDSTRKIFVPGK